MLLLESLFLQDLLSTGRSYLSLVNIPHFLYFTDTQFSEADLARSLLFTISNDVGQVASLYAMMHKLNKVIQYTDNHSLLHRK
jgi:pantothenate kinase